MIKRALANGALMAGSMPAVARLRRALKNPRAAQEAVLARLLAANAGSAFGREHGLSRVKTLAEFQAAVPVRGYDGHAPWVRRAMDGEPGVLTSEPVRLFEVTSGSSGAEKHIPYTASLQSEFRSAVGAWLGELALERPAVMAGPSYWSVTPLSRRPTRTAGGIPVGFSSDAEVLGGWVGRLMERRLAVPSAVALCGDLDAALYATARFLLQEPGLRFVSVWNPSFLTLLLARVEADAERLLSDLAAGTLRPSRPLPPEAALALNPRLKSMPARARELGPLLARRAWSEVWPRLDAVSCWADASAGTALPAVKAAFPSAVVQGKGLLATEGVVSVPVADFGGCVPALTSHLLEFRLWDGAAGAGPGLLADQIEAGCEYDLVMTTGGGLWRYSLGDVVKVSRVVGRVPVLEFVGRGAAASDLRGEKLSAAFVGPVLAKLGARGLWSGPFAMLAPGEGEPPSYTLFIEGRAAPGLAVALDEGLRENPHYDYCRRLGQLGAPAVFLVTRGANEAYLSRCREAGQRAGAVKPASLDGRAGWAARFAGSFADAPAGAVA